MAERFIRTLKEQAIFIVTVWGSYALLLLPYVLHDEFDNDCIEDGTRERCSKFLLINRDQRAYLNRMLRLETEPALANATFCALPA